MKTLAPASRKEDRLLQAMGLMCIYVALIVYVNACGKVMAQTYPPFEVTLFRHGIAFLWMLTLFAPRHGPRILLPRRPGLQILRGAFGIASSLFYFTGLMHLSLASAAAISFSTPLIVAALSGPLLGERVGLHRWAAIVAGFVGTLIIIRPGGGSMDQWSGLLLVGSAICAALYQVITRRLAGQDHAETTSIWTGFVGTCIVLAMSPFFFTLPTHWLDWGLFLSMGIIGGSAHYLLTKAFERAPAALLSPFNYLQLLGATFTGWVLYRNLPDEWTWAGAAVIVGAGLYIARRENRRPVAVSAEPSRSG
ncbi:MAG: DMT family transporter [Acetobacteraceae bacterium]